MEICRIYLFASEFGVMMRCFEYGNETLCFIKGGEFFDCRLILVSKQGQLLLKLSRNFHSISNVI